MTNKPIRLGARLTALGVAATAALSLATLPAAASSDPTVEQLMADCASGTGKCTFNDPVVDRAYLGDYRQVSDTLYNCSSSPASQGLGWSDTVGSSDSLDVSVTAGGKIAGIVEASVTAKYGHTRTTSHSDSGSLGMTVQPGEVGWISRAQAMQQVSGKWQTHYDNPHWGHYYWFWKDTVTSPTANGTDGVSNAVVVKSRAMTPDEKASCTGANAQLVRGPNLHQNEPTNHPGTPGPHDSTPQPGDTPVATPPAESSPKQ
ncbi:hypothetical protein [Kitasatospora kifunensis]|uniref:Uncharacterized protein n=1 Tax=Kitasatospora kifunensis TaxID=58351 RepID=A0A7W7RAD3_KITKI|nr:hypothetical protein [Kitasatospora kifunensis]MBB4927671.1 hypothetical protein [Kitasatospora kifunensis]